MTKLTTMTLVVMLTGCGAAQVGGGKQGAAAALAAAAKPTKAGADRSVTPILLPEVNYTCPEGGSATMSNFDSQQQVSGSGAKVVQRFTLTYKGCGLAKSEAGVAIYEGSFTVEQNLESSATGATVNQRFAGRVTITGAFNDFLEADVTQSLAASALGSESASMKLVGTLKNSSGSYTYDEELSVSGGIPVAKESVKQN